MRAIKRSMTRHDDIKKPKGGLFNTLPVGLLVFDENACLVNANDHIFKTFNMARINPEGKQFGALFRCQNMLQHGGECGRMQACQKCVLMENVKRVMRTGDAKTGLDVIIDSDINGRLATQYFSVNLTRVSEASRQYVLASLTETTAKRQAERELFTLGISDELTGLYTRRYVLKKLDELIQYNRPESSPISVVLMEIDSTGSADAENAFVYDAEIQNDMAETLREHTQGTDIIGRVGENQFLAVLVNLDDGKARGIISDVLTAFRRKTKARTGKSVSFSTGMISVDALTGSVSEVKDYIHDIEVLLDKAKQEGSGQMEAEQEIMF